jgi:hypothetical protein
VLERPRLFLREDDHLSGSLSESLEHGAANPSCWGVALASGRAWSGWVVGRGSTRLVHTYRRASAV